MSERLPGPASQTPPSPTQRIDKWLWYTRLFKSRSLAAKFVETGRIRVKSGGKRTKFTKPSQVVRVGDILTFPQGHDIRVYQVLAPGKRRGPAQEAQSLYADLTPPKAATAGAAPEKISSPTRAKGEGRPTKKDRRALDRLQAPETDGETEAE